MKTYFLGISAFYHNSAAALVCEGRIVAAAEEERFTRVKGDSSFPINAISYCLDYAGISVSELTAIAYYENPNERFGRIITSCSLTAPKGIVQYLAAVPEWISNKLWVEKKIRKELDCKKNNIVFFPHHLSHAASAFYPSPYENAAILTADGVGEWETLSVGTGSGNKIELTEVLRYPNSLGLLYSAFTMYTGFKINNGEYKMMGLAPYGNPVYADTIKEKLIKIAEDGSFVINQEYFGYSYGVRTINKNFEKLFGKKARRKDEEITEFHADIAASIQSVTNEILLKTARHIKEITNKDNLCLAGGVALNVTATGLIRESGIFKNVWIQPAAGDAGAAVGAAFEAYYRTTEKPREVLFPDSMNGAFLGYEIEGTDAEDDKRLESLGAVWTVFTDEELYAEIAELVSEGKVVGIARGRAEFGPRALGHRSILADARNPDMLQTLNMKIKFREGFRPFAPVIIREFAKEYFEISGDSPYMTFVFPLKKEKRIPFNRKTSFTETAAAVRSEIPAITHVDYSSRIQTVGEDSDPFLYGVLNKFHELTGCPVMVNTSFNTAEEPIVNDVVDAYKCFMRSGIDFVVIGNRYFDKKKQNKNEFR